MRKTIAACAAVAAGMLALSACNIDDGPRCVSSHMETQWVTVIGPKGAVSMHPVFTTVCDRYETPTPKASSGA
jgi:hypothetical protein